MDSFDYFVDNKVRELIRTYNIQSVCDYGCGEGELLARLVKDGAINPPLVGVDVFSQFCCNNLRPKTQPGIEFVDRETPQFETLLQSRQFDLVVSSQTLHHFRTPIKELRNLWRLTKDGGLLLLVDVDFSRETDGQITKNLHSLLSEALSAMRGSFHRHHLTLEEALDLVSAVPFRVLEARTETLHPDRVEKEDTTQRVLDGVSSSLDKIKFRNPLVGNVFHQAFGSFKELAKSTGVEYTSLMCILLQKEDRV